MSLLNLLKHASLSMSAHHSDLTMPEQKTRVSVSAKPADVGTTKNYATVFKARMIEIILMSQISIMSHFVFCAYAGHERNLFRNLNNPKLLRLE